MAKFTKNIQESDTTLRIQNQYYESLDKVLNQDQRQIIGKHLFCFQESCLQGIKNFQKQQNFQKITNTDEIVNNREWLLDFQNVMIETDLFKLNPSKLESFLKASEETKGTAFDAKARLSLVHMLLTERQFFVNLIQSLIKKLLSRMQSFGQSEQNKTLFQRVIPSFKNENFPERQFSKFEEENVGKITPPKLRQVIMSPVSREGKQTQTPVSVTPRVQLNKSPAQTARNHISARFNFPDSSKNSGQNQLKRLLHNNVSQETFQYSQKVQGTVFDANEANYEESTAFQANQTTDTYKKMPYQEHTKISDNRIQKHQRVKSTENLIYSKYGKHSKEATKLRRNFNEQSSSKSSGKNVLKDYNKLFKRKESVQLKHKWESDDDDSCANVKSNDSKRDTHEEQSFLQSVFELDTSRTQDNFNRHTGTFTQREMNYTTDHQRDSSPHHLKPSTNQQSSFISNNKTHNKPEPQTVTKTNHANVRNPIKQTIIQQKSKKDLTIKVPQSPTQKVPKNELVKAVIQNQKFIQDHTQTNQKLSHINMLNVVKSNPTMKDISVTSTTTQKFAQPKMDCLSSISKQSSQKTGTIYNQSKNKSVQQDALKPQQRPKESHNQIKQTTRELMLAVKNENDESKDLTVTTKNLASNTSAYDAKKDSNKMNNIMQPSYQSSKCDHQSSSKSQSQLRSRSANRYFIEEDEEDLNETQPNFALQLSLNSELETELQKIKFEASAVQSEQQQKPLKQVKHVIEPQPHMSLKSLQRGGKVANLGNMNHILTQLNESKTSSLFKCEQTRGSPPISNRMRQMQSQESLSGNTGSMKDFQQQLALKQPPKQKEMPIAQTHLLDDTGGVRLKNANEQNQKLGSDLNTIALDMQKKLKTNEIANKKLQGIQNQVKTVQLSSQGSPKQNDTKASLKNSSSKQIQQQPLDKKQLDNQLERQSDQKFVEFKSVPVKVGSQQNVNSINQLKKGQNQQVVGTNQLNKAQSQKNNQAPVVAFRAQESEHFSFQESSLDSNTLKQKNHPNKIFNFQESIEIYDPKTEFKFQQQNQTSLDQKLALMASRDRGTQNSKIQYNTDDFFNDMPLNDNSHQLSDKRVLLQSQGLNSNKDDEALFNHLRSQELFDPTVQQKNDRTVVFNSSDAQQQQKNQTEDDKEIQNQSDQNEFQLELQLVNTESYDFGQIFDETSNYKVEYGPVSTQKSPVDTNKPSVRQTGVSSIHNQSKMFKAQSEQSFNIEEANTSTIYVPMITTPDTKSQKKRQIQQTQESQDIWSESSEEVEDYFQGVEANNTSNQQNLKVFNETENNDEVRTSPNDLKSYYQTFNGEEKIQDEKKKGQTGQTLMHGDIQFKQYAQGKDLVSDYSRENDPIELRSSQYNSKDIFSQKSVENDIFDEIASAEQSIQSLNNIKVDTIQANKKNNQIKGKISPRMDELISAGDQLNFQQNQPKLHAFEQRKKDNRTLFGVESSASIEQEKQKQNDEYGNPLEFKSNQNRPDVKNVLSERASDGIGKGFQGLTFDIMSGASALSMDSQSQGADNLVRNFQRKLI